MPDVNFLTPSSRVDFDALLEALDSPHVIVSGSGELVVANKACAHLFSDNPGFVEGYDIVPLLNGDESLLRELLRTALGVSTPLPLRLDLPGANTPTHFQAVAKRIAFHDARAGVLIRLRRIREGTSVFAELNQQIGVLHRRLGAEAHERRMLADVNRDLERFAAVAAHDLRAPLGQLMTMLEVFEMEGTDKLSTLQREVLQMMATASSRMSALVDALLDHSRMADAEVAKEPINLADTVREAAENLIEPIIETDATIQPGPLPTVACDPTLVRQIFQNVLSNSLKYRRDSVPPTIRVFANTIAGAVVVRISDNGRGFGGADTADLFRPFSRLANGLDQEGSGIGLATCMSIAARHGWKISAAENDDAGATIIIRIPAHQIITAETGEAPDEE
ncbi:MAG: hypothetical protein JJ900_12500 [Rhodospirillales bacterium]|nr:hypothetical protein [Rhodospirillales bacterium]MBO6787664.1 hypothetical protein [Rhodospirillales bacterium]